MFGQRREKKGGMVWIPVFQTVSQLSFLTARTQQEDQFMDHRGQRRQKEHSSWDVFTNQPKFLVGPESDLL